MKCNRLQDYLWPLGGALLINVMLFLSVAVLSRDHAPNHEMTVPSPVHLASTFTLPSKPAVAEQREHSMPESPADVPKPPLVPASVEPEVPAEAAAAIEAPEVQREKVPDLPAVKMPQPIKKQKPKPKPTKIQTREPKPASVDSTAKPPESSSSSTSPTDTAGSSFGAGAGDSSTGDLSSKEFGLDEVDLKPQVLKQEKPAYPLLARRRNLTGKVTVKFLVDRHGNIRKPKILEAHPQGVFEQSVLESIVKWRFKPGVYKGREVATWVVLPIQFRLTNG
ncbi:MAG: TonB family protein [Desulforhabdus sp.]|jgi:protein TonB|nr:TonB family protein [Desulforhabdus sp.]